jgi:hypothetical protein
VTKDTDFSLSLSDVHQGVSNIWYTIDGVYFEGTSFDLSQFADGMLTISWGSVDNLGLNETGNLMIVYLDTTPPESDLVIDEPKYRFQSSDPWSVNSDTHFNIESSDEHSEVDYDWYIIDEIYKKGSSFTLGGYSEGSHTITWGSMDNLGHDKTGGTLSVDIDLQAPVITIIIGEPSMIVDDVIYLTSSTEISFIYEDSGINQTTVYYSLDGGTRFDTYNSPFTVPSQTTSIIFGGEDILGNSQEDTELIVAFDNTDTDSDGIPDLDDDDDDNDGLLDSEEDINQNGVVDFGETDPKKLDTDSDGYNDSEDSFPLDKTKWNQNGDGNGTIFIVIIMVVVVLIILLLFFVMQKKEKGNEVEWEGEEQVDFQKEIANSVQPQQVPYYPPPPPPQEEVEFETEEEVEFQDYN